MARCEPSGCFRPDQRNRRVRPGAQDRPYSIFETTTPGPTTSTTTSTTAVPHPLKFLRDYVKIPNSGAICPAITTTEAPFYFNAYGGEKKVINKNLIVHEFSSNDTFSIFPYADQRDGFFANVNILLVGGGGGGGQFDGGGGGGAGEVYQASYKFPTGSYQVVIGSG